MCSRRGFGKTRHVQTRFLWVQHKVHEKEIELVSVGTDKNVSDLCTKAVPHDVCAKRMSAIGQHYASGSSAAAKGVT